jgi:hypothetical protein
MDKNWNVLRVENPACRVSESRILKRRERGEEPQRVQRKVFNCEGREEESSHEFRVPSGVVKDAHGKSG